MELEYQTTLPDTDLEVLITFDYTPYDPGRTSGPPENCYPPEGGDAEITSIITTPGGDELEPLLRPWVLKNLVDKCETWARERQSAGEL